MYPLRFFLTACLVALSLTSCGGAGAGTDPKLYGHWQFSGCSYKDNGVDKRGLVGGEIDLGQDGQCHGERVIGTIVGSLDGPFTVSGNRLTLKAEADVTYTFTITEGESNGTPVWILALDNGSMVFDLVRKREKQ